MDKAGVDLAVVSLTCPSVFWGTREQSIAAARAINDDMAAQQREHPDRIRFLATLPWQHPTDAVEELQRALSLGAVGVMCLANIEGEHLTDERFAPIWAAIDRAALPVLIHPTLPPGADLMALNRFHMAWNVGFPSDTTLALTRMILSGFLDEYPSLKIIGGHAGGFLPFLLPRLDKGHEAFPTQREVITELPSEYARRLFVDSIAYSSAALQFTVDALGADQLLYGSDYPHLCGRMEEIDELVGTLGAATAAKVRSGNAERIFALDGVKAVA
jgi:aminocarboxymuconate-semialdehyde decarboxylase